MYGNTEWFCMISVSSRCYLSQCSQCVKTDDTLSNAQHLDIGVPQGTVLGPILFTMYTASLSKLTQGFTFISDHRYVGDTQIYTN